MTTLEEKVTEICATASEEINAMPYEERKWLAKYLTYQKILTIWQTLHSEPHLTTEAWRKKQRTWLENCVRSYQEEERGR